MKSTVQADREPFHWRTAIAYKTKDRIVVRGYDLNDLVGNLTFTEMAYLVWRGELPKEHHARMLDDIYVSMAEHAFSPSSAACRFVASGGVPLHVGVAGGLLAIGALHGTADRPAELFKGAVERMQQEHLTLEETARKVAGQAHAARQRLPGFHHPQHIIDPRTARLLQLADAYGVSGSHVAMARAIEAATEAYWGRRIYLNGPGAVGAICLDMGFDTELIKGVFLLSRTISLVAHTHEEMQREKGWRRRRALRLCRPSICPCRSPNSMTVRPSRRFPPNEKRSSS